MLLDASALWLEAVNSVVRRTGFDVVARATSCSDARAALDEYQPDLLVADLSVASPNDGLECIKRARADRPDLRAVALASGSDPELINSALSSGASAYVLKSSHPDDLSSAIRQAFDSSVYFADAYRHPPASLAPPLAPNDTTLTRREREILRLVAEGHSNAQLARLLWVAEQTVKFHLSNVYRKLNVSNRTEAARWAQVNGLLASPTISTSSEFTAV